MRKTVSVVFCDVTGSTSLGEQLDPEALRGLMTRYFDDMKAIVVRHGGIVEKFIGDAVVAVFGVPAVHEDDALRALRAAAEMQRSIARTNEEIEHSFGTSIHVRIGVNTGEVVVGDVGSGSSFVSGDAVNVAARLEQSASPGEILIGEQTFALVRDAVVTEPVPLAVKGKSRPVGAHRLVELRDVDTGIVRAMGSPLVGREEELAALQRAVQAAADERACRLITLLGAAGAGKSRLTLELLREASGRMTVLRGRCLPYGEGITFWPVREMVRHAADISDDDSLGDVRAKIAALLGSSDDARLARERLTGLLGIRDEASDQQEIFWAFRLMLERIAAEMPVLVVFDDIHWGEESLLDLVEYLVDFVSDCPVAVLCLARPELLDVRPGWTAPRSNALSITLPGLERPYSERLIENLLDAPFPEALRALLADRGEGNPLFIQEMVRMLVEQGKLHRCNGRWELEADESSLSIPPTVNALMAARLDQLPAEERDVLQRASVVGQAFWWSAVADLSDDHARRRVGAHLRSLVARQLIRPDRSSLAGEDAFAFSHILLRDAAYNSLPKSVRAELHRRFAAWTESRAGERLGEYEEILGYHLEQAHRLGTEVGAPEAERRQLALAATNHLRRAGSRALQRGDAAAATNLLRRALGLKRTDEPERARLLVDLATASGRQGLLDEAAEMLDEAMTLADAAGDTRVHSHAALERQGLRIEADPEGATDAAAAEVQRLLPTLHEIGDDAGLARAYNLMCQVHNMRMRHAAQVDAAERAMLHARRADDRAQEAEAVSNLGVAMMFGPTPAGEVEAVVDELLADTPHNLFAKASLLATRGHAHAAMGRIEEARADAAASREILRDLGMRVSRAAFAMGLSEIERLAGDLPAAEAQLRDACRVLEDAGALSYLSTAAAMCASRLLDQGKDTEVAPFLALAEAAGASDDTATSTLVSSARARLLSRAGRNDEAIDLARRAVAGLRSTDAVTALGEALVALSEVEGSAGQIDDSSAHAQEALELFERKGDIITSRWLRAALGHGPGE